MNWQQRIRNALNIRKTTKTLRKRTVVESGSGPFLIYNRRHYLNFSSNNYLGLSNHPMIIRAWQEGVKNFGVGSGGSGHCNGYTIAHQKLEEMLAHWLNYPRALLFISGFSANQAVITALLRKTDRVVADRLSHASLLEAANFSSAQLRRFVHNDIVSLTKLLNNSCQGQQLVVTEGVFSMDGDIAPLACIYKITKKKNAWLMVDDAHGIGVIGRSGRGSCDVQKIKPEILIITFGKAFGISGAAVLCNNEMAQYLLQFAKHLIYSTSMPPAQALALQEAIKIIRSDDGEQLRHRLAQNIHLFRKGVSNLKGWLTTSHTAIQPLIVGDNIRTLQLEEHLRHIGIWTTAIRPPTVPVGTARLRLTLTAAHEHQDIITLLEALHDIN